MSYKVLKATIIILCVGLIYFQISPGKGYSSLVSIWQSKEIRFSHEFLLFCFILMPVNWGLEAFKWQILMSPHEKTSLSSSLRTIMAGITLGIVTPARIGEYGGRLLTSDPEKKPLIIAATLLGSIAQNLCTIFSGIAFSYFFLKSLISVTYFSDFTFVLLVITQIAILLLIYYHMPKVALWVEANLKYSFIRKISKSLKSLECYTPVLLNKVFAVSALRYLVYFIQYVFIMKWMDVALPLPQICGNIAGIYLIQTAIPLPAFLSVFARGEVALLVWSGSGVAAIQALGATFMLWLINLILPAFSGIFVLAGVDIKKYFIHRKH